MRGFILRGVELPIIQIVEQGGELDDEGIRVFVFTDGDGVLPDPIDVPPIVPGRIVGEFLFDIVGGFLKDIGLSHAAYFATEWMKRPLHSQPKLASLPQEACSTLQQRKLFLSLSLERGCESFEVFREVRDVLAEYWQQ